MILLLLEWQFSLRQGSWLGHRKQILLQYECVHAVGVVARNSASDVIAVAFVEREGSSIIHRRLQPDSMAVLAAEAVFGSAEQACANSKASDSRQYINGDNVPFTPWAAMCDQKTQNQVWGVAAGRGFRRNLLFCNQCERIPPADVSSQLQTSVCDSGVEALLIDLKERFEVVRTRVSQRKFHWENCNSVFMSILPL
jgi:hypothetical protein